MNGKYPKHPARFTLLPAGLLAAVLLVGCGGGGGDRAAGVEPGPPPPGGSTPPPAPLPPPEDPTTIDVDAIAPGDTVDTGIESVSMASPPSVTFRLEVDGRRVTGLTTSDLRLTLAELVPEQNFDISSWVSFINTTEDPVCRSQADVDASTNACTTFTAETDPALIPDTALKVSDPVAVGKVVTTQVTSESNGTLTDNEDGTWTYTYATDPGDPATLANPLRSCIQFGLNAPAVNPCVDFVPEDLVDPAVGEAATSLAPDYYDVYPSRQIATEATCNTCHDQLALHGGGRTAIDYCVTCHNPGTVDANSANTVDMKVFIHRIHNARNLDSVQSGTPYKIWGFRNGEHDFSHVSYPQSVSNCTRCHAGQEDVDFAAAEGLPMPEAEITPDGHNWAIKASPDTCLSCHEGAVDHVADRTSCSGCHGPGGRADVQQVHRNLLEEQGRALALDVESVTNTGAGENPVIVFSVSRDGTPVDVLDPAQFDGDVRFRIAWDAATEYLNSGGSSPPISVTDAIATALPDNRFQIDTTGLTPIPDGIDTLGVHGALDETTPDGTASAMSPGVFVASSAATATPRRIVVSSETCNACHHRLSMHAPGGRSVTDNPQNCTGCHEPNRQSSGAGNSTDFSVLIHGLHASGFRESPYRDYDEETLQFPGNLADCATCHVNGSYRLPLPLRRAPLKDATSTSYTTPVAAACAACHDGSVAAAHMESTGGAVFNGTFDEASQAVESCEVCHRTGALADIDVEHSR